VNARIPSVTLEGISLVDLVFKKILAARRMALSVGPVSVIVPDSGRPTGAISSASAAVTGVNVSLAQGFPAASFVAFERGQATFMDPVYNTADGFYTFTARSVHISQAASSLEINGLEMVPRYKKGMFARKRGYRSTRLHLKTGRVLFNKVDFKDLFKNRRFHCGRLLIENPSLEIYRDKNVPKRRKPEIRKFPQQQLREAKFQLFLEHLGVTGGNLIYTERTQDKNRAGTVFFHDIRVDMTNVTNYPEKLEAGVPLELNASLAVIGKGLLTVSIKLPLADKRNRFDFSGTLGPMNMKLFNTMLIPAANARIDRGRLDRLDFSASGNSWDIEGEMRFRYRNLKISLLKRTGSQKKRKFRSFLANMVIYESNPRRGKLRVGKISYKKEMPMTIFTYMWKSLLTGLKSSLGLSKAKK